MKLCKFCSSLVIARYRLAIAHWSIYSTDHLLNRFQVQLDELAHNDRLTTITGLPRYIQDIIIPEIVLVLIQEDMKVDKDQAHNILESSMYLGELLQDTDWIIYFKVTGPLPN